MKPEKKLKPAVGELKRLNMKIAAAESFTGGLLADAFVKTPGASEVFLGSLVCYDTGIKKDVLGVPSSVLKKGVVSRECAEAMAKRALKLFGADIAISTTGFADKSNEPGIPDGAVYISAAAKGRMETVYKVLKGSRNANRKAGVKIALELLNGFLE